MTKLVLGLDGGGTQTRAALADLSGRIIGTGSAGACNLAAVPPAEALGAALAAADSALQHTGASRAEVASLCAGVAGVSFTDRQALFLSGLQAAFPAALVSVEPDYAIALTGATGSGAGILVIAGTGSAAFGQNKAGQTHRTGAYGYLLDDSGSGYGVGRAALAAVLRADDGTGPSTSLTERVPAALGLSSLSEIIPGIYGGGISRVAVAALSQIVAKAARENGDEVSRALLMRAGGALAHLAEGVCRRLFSEPGVAYPLVQSGGLWNAGSALTDIFTRSLRRFAPGAVVTPALHPPVEGAALLARQRLAGAQKSSGGS